MNAPSDGFEMIWINGNKHLIGAKLYNDIKAEREKVGKMYGTTWQDEHTARVQAETRLEIAESVIADLRAQIEAERNDDR